MAQMVTAELQIGSKVYVREAVAGEPGLIRELADGVATVEWLEFPEHSLITRHSVEELVPDGSFLSGWPDASAHAA